MIAKHLKKAAVRTKDTAKNLMDDGQITPEEHASDQMKYAAQDTAETAEHTVKSGVNKAKEGLGKASAQIRSNKQNAMAATEKKNRPLRKERTIRCAEEQKRSIKQTARSAGKQTIKTKGFVCGTGSAAKKADKGIKTAARTTGKAGRIVRHGAKEAKRETVTVTNIPQRTVKKARQAVDTVVKTVKAITASSKGLTSAIAAGGGILLVIVVFILMVAMMAGSVFGIFLSDEDFGTGMTLRQAVRQINADYLAEKQEIREGIPHDEIVVSGAMANWREVLAVYAVCVNTDPDNPREVVSMDWIKFSILKDIFWDMNELDVHCENETKTIVETSVDENGEPVETEIEITKVVLYITVLHKTAADIAEESGFTEEQKAQLAEMLSEENAGLWNSVLFGFDYSGQIVEVALSQLGNSGETYWAFLGFTSRVEWCACFVTWCANECGYLDAGALPRTASCTVGEQWLKERGLWQDASYTPIPGDIIYFDWDKEETNSQDGIPDHVGIVERVENGYIYTVEGNSGDRVSNNAWAAGSYEIYGYGVPWQ